MTPCRVLHIVGRMDRAGAETMIMNLYRETDRQKYQFDFVYFTADACDYDDEIKALGGHIYRIRSVSPASRFLALYRILQAGEWPIVHAHTLFSSGLHLSAARLAGVPERIAHSHNTQDTNSQSLFGRAYQHVSKLLLQWAATSFVACGAAAADYLFFPRNKVTVIPNAVDIGKFSEATGAKVRSEFGIESDALVLIQIGRFMPVKNHERVIQISGAMMKAGINFHLLLVGTGPEKPKVELLAADNGLDGNVHFLGNRGDIPELMAAADVMIMPSLHEGFPVVLVEAQAAGLPAVVSSAVSKEVDLGVGLVSFVDLGAENKTWIGTLHAAASGDRLDEKTRRIALEKRGFSSAAGVKQLERVYSTS